MRYCLEFQNYKIKKKLGKFSYTAKNKLEILVEELYNLEDGWEEVLRIEMLYCIEEFRLQYMTSYVEYRA